MKYRAADLTGLELRCLRRARDEFVPRDGTSDADAQDAYAALTRKGLMDGSIVTPMGHAVLYEASLNPTPEA